MRVVETHQAFAATIDEKGNPCQEYFTNLDRIEIVSDAYNYVHNLWERGKCDCKEFRVWVSIIMFDMKGLMSRYFFRLFQEGERISVNGSNRRRC